MDAFTKIGGEVYAMTNGFIGMAAVTGGEIRGAVLQPDERAPSLYGKVGIDRLLSNDLRVRLTGSAYTTAKSLSNTVYVGGRYNVVDADLGGVNGEVTVDRIQVGAGWFTTPNVLLKLEYVRQNYDGYVETDIHHAGEFNGLMIEGVIAF